MGGHKHLVETGPSAKKRKNPKANRNIWEEGLGSWLFFFNVYFVREEETEEENISRRKLFLRNRLMFENKWL